MDTRSTERRKNPIQMALPGLWDENLAETGVRALAQLDFEVTVHSFNALLAGRSLDDLQSAEPAAVAAFNAAMHWQPLIAPWLGSGAVEKITATGLERLIKNFLCYDFGIWLTRFQTAVLLLLTGLLSQSLQDNGGKAEGKNAGASQGPTQLAVLTETLTGLLLKAPKSAGLKTHARQLALTAHQNYPKDGRLAYLLAHCYLKNGQRKEAYNQFANCLLMYPDLAKMALEQSFLSFLPPATAQYILADQPIRTLIIGTIENIFPLVKMPAAPDLNNPAADKGHKIYLLFLAAEQSHREQAPFKDVVRHRKALFDADETIGSIYMNQIRSKYKK